MSTGSTADAGHRGDLTTLFGGHSGDDVVDLLDRDWSGSASFTLERALRVTPCPIEIVIR